MITLIARMIHNSGHSTERVLKVRKTSGFTLVESLIAVTIIAFSIAGPLYSASRSLVAAQSAQDKLIATYLAQEGVEYVREMRDDAYLGAYQAGGPTVSTDAWNTFLSGPGDASVSQCRVSTCKLDPVQAMGTSLTQCAGANCGPLYRRNDGVYTLQVGGNIRTPFTRTLQVINVPLAAANPTEVRVVSRVSWDFHGLAQSVTVVDHLMPWQ